MEQTMPMKPEDRRARAARRKKLATKIDVRALREQLGALAGKRRLSFVEVGELLDLAELTVRKWEHGGPISAPNYAKLVELKKKLDAGEFKLPKKFVAKPSATTKKKNAVKKDTKTTTPATEIAGEAPVFYANVVEVVKAERDTVLRFGLLVPGERAAAVVEIVVPLDVLDSTLAYSPGGGPDQHAPFTRAPSGAIR